MRFGLFIIMTAITFGACSYVNKKLHMDDDNIIEEAFEQQLKEATGIDMDFTPSSEETK